MAVSALSVSPRGPSLDAFFEVAKSGESPTRPLVVDGNEIRVIGDLGGCCCSNILSSSSSAIERDVNRRTWEAFERAVLQASGDERVFALRSQRMKLRYQVDFEAAKVQGPPLLIDHIDRVAVGNARVFMQDLHVLLAGESVNGLSREELATRIAELQQGTSYIGKCAPAHEIRGGPDSCVDLFYYDPFKWDRKRVHLSQNVELLKWPEHRIPDLPYIERVAKVFTSLEMEEGEIIPSVSLAGGVDYYEVYRKIGTGDGLVAYALRPIAHDSELIPSLYFRPTQISLVSEDTVETWFNDCEENIGQTGYQAAHEHFAALMSEVSFRRHGQKIRLVGYSLGSSQAQRFLERFWRSVKEAILLNGPSIDEETATRFKDEIMNYQIGEGEMDPFPEIHIYRNRASDNVAEGDIADYAGRMHLGCGIRREDFKLYLTEFRNAPHAGRGFFGPHSYRAGEPVHRAQMEERGVRVVSIVGEDLHRELDNFERGENIAWYERTRLFWGTQVLYRVIYAVYLFVKTVLSCFGAQLFRSSSRATTSV